MPLFVVVLLKKKKKKKKKKRFIIKKQKEKRKTRDEKTREVKMDIKRRLRPILHQTRKFLLSVFKLTATYKKHSYFLKLLIHNKNLKYIGTKI